MDARVGLLDGLWRQLSGNNCFSKQADRCTRDHISSDLILQRHDEPKLFLERPKWTQFGTQNPTRPGSVTIELDCISTIRSFELSFELFDTQIEVETNATLEVRFLDYAGVPQKVYTITNSSKPLNPDFSVPGAHGAPDQKLGHFYRTGCNDTGDGLPINQPDNRGVFNRY